MSTLLRSRAEIDQERRTIDVELLGPVCQFDQLPDQGIIKSYPVALRLYWPPILGRRDALSCSGLIYEVPRDEAVRLGGRRDISYYACEHRVRIIE